MKRKGVYVLVSGLVAVAAVALLLTLVILPGSAGISRPGVSAPDVASAPMVASSAIAPAVQETASAPGSPQESIKVHGHWTIEVRNPDGSMAERREFDNALYPTFGGRILVKVMARQNSFGGWMIQLPGSPNAFTKVNTEGLIAESSWPGTVSSVFETLTVSMPTSGVNAYKLVLSGTATAQQDGNITSVSTLVFLLPPSEPPSGTYPSGSQPLTDTTLASPVNLTTGQQVLVTVVISFS